jgi:MFS transporter
MTAVNFAVAMALPRLNTRIPNRVLLVTGVLLTLAGMAWLSRLNGGYLNAVALPMLFIGAGQGLTFVPTTSYGITDVTTHDAGAASGLLNTAHQLGMALGLGFLVTLAADHTGTANITAHVTVALTGASVLLALSVLTAPPQAGSPSSTSKTKPACSTSSAH